MSTDLAGRVALVTGGASGIGAATARALAQADNHIGMMLLHRVVELSSMKAHRKDDLFQTRPPR